MKNVLRKILCWPLFFGTLVALVVRALWGESMRWDNAVLVTVLSEKSWPMRSWYQKWGGTCFGYGIMLAPNQGPTVLAHELHHVEQNEAGTVAGLLLGLLVLLLTQSWQGLAAMIVCWITFSWFAYIAALIVAWLRGEDAYRGNHLEEGAYDATKR
jgi:hypothetical protein